MAKDGKIDTLRALPLFAGASAGQLQRVAAIADEATVEAGAVLVVRSEMTSDLYVIESGIARVTSGDREATELGPGDAFGEVPLPHEHDDAATETIIAETDLRLLVVRRPAFELLQANAPALTSALAPAAARHGKQAAAA